MPVCLSACKELWKQGSSNKEVQKKVDRKTFILTRQDQLHHLDWDAKSGNKYRTFDHDPSYMRSAPSDGIKYSLQQNEAPLDEEGKVQKLASIEALTLTKMKWTVVKARWSNESGRNV